MSSHGWLHRLHSDNGENKRCTESCWHSQHTVWDLGGGGGGGGGCNQVALPWIHLSYQCHMEYTHTIVTRAHMVPLYHTWMTPRTTTSLMLIAHTPGVAEIRGGGFFSLIKACLSMNQKIADGCSFGLRHEWISQEVAWGSILFGWFSPGKEQMPQLNFLNQAWSSLMCEYET